MAFGTWCVPSIAFWSRTKSTTAAASCSSSASEAKTPRWTAGGPAYRWGAVPNVWPLGRSDSGGEPRGTGETKASARFVYRERFQSETRTLNLILTRPQSCWQVPIKYAIQGVNRWCPKRIDLAYRLQLRTALVGDGKAPPGQRDPSETRRANREESHFLHPILRSYEVNPVLEEADRRPWLFVSKTQLSEHP